MKKNEYKCAMCGGLFADSWNRMVVEYTYHDIAWLFCIWNSRMANRMTKMKQNIKTLIEMLEIKQ